MTPCRPSTVDLDLIRKIEAVALDDRGDPRTREIALNKLGAFKISHPHLFSEPYRVEDDANPWSDVADVGVEESPPWPPAPSDKDRARFLDINRWRQTANGNLSTLVAMARGQGCRIVLFQH